MYIKVVFFCISAVIFTFSSASQNELQINYTIKNGEITSEGKETAILKANKKNVIFTEQVHYMVPSKQGKYQVDQTVNQTFKDNTTNELWALEDWTNVVKEEMNLFNWKFSTNIDSVLNYKCRKATTHFRGRNYEVWFTTEIPFKAAPWKIHGLPGVVLKLQVDKDYYYLEAVELSIIDSEKVIENPFKNKKAMSWEEYLVFYAEDQKAKLEYAKAMEIQDGRSYDWAYPKIEIINERNRETYDEGIKRMGLWQTK